MPQRALYDLAESVLGRAPEMHWSMDEGIARRETSRLFQRLYKGETSADTALEVFLIGMVTKLRNSLSVIEDRYNSLIVTLTHEEQGCCPTLNEFFEFFTNLSDAAEYSLSEDITRTELSPLFEACQAHVLTAEDCQDAVFDYSIAKRDVVLTTLQVTVQKLNGELSEVLKVRAEKNR